MSAITVELPNSLRKKLEELAKKEGFSLEQFIASAASEKTLHNASNGLFRK